MPLQPLICAFPSKSHAQPLRFFWFICYFFNKNNLLKTRKTSIIPVRQKYCYSPRKSAKGHQVTKHTSLFHTTNPAVCLKPVTAKMANTRRTIKPHTSPHLTLLHTSTHNLSSNPLWNNQPPLCLRAPPAQIHKWTDEHLDQMGCTADLAKGAELRTDFNSLCSPLFSASSLHILHSSWSSLLQICFYHFLCKFQIILRSFYFFLLFSLNFSYIWTNFTAN